MVDVTDDELWARVGKTLAEARVLRGFDKHWQYVDRHREPAVATIKNIEAGRPGNVSSVAVYATKLGLSLPSILLSILSEAGSATLPTEIQAVVDALQLRDTHQPNLANWQTATKAAAAIVLRQGIRTTAPIEAREGEGPEATPGKRQTRGTRKR